MQPQLTPPPPSLPPLNTRVSLILRLAFYVGTGLIGLQIIPLIFAYLGGVVVAATVGLFFLAVIANLLTMRVFDRRPLTDIGLGGGHGTGQNLMWGLALGGGAAALMMLAPVIARAAHFQSRPESVFAWPNLIFYLVALLFGAAGEEILFRGYAFQLLIEKAGAWATILPVGVLFGLAHSGNPSATWLAVLNTTLWGVLFGYAFLRSRDLWLPIGLHYGWNLVLPLFGANLSGLTIEITRYGYKWDLGTLWSGGSYGPEGGILTTIFVCGLFAVLHRVPIVPQTACIAVSLNEPA
jgi:membrane protease YdiL (CAAX protease family)